MHSDDSWLSGGEDMCLRRPTHGWMELLAQLSERQRFAPLSFYPPLGLWVCGKRETVFSAYITVT